MNILYIHGLNSSLSPEKRSIVEKYGSVEAPSIDYESHPDRIQWLHDQYKDHKIDVIIGSSMGGFAGYHLSRWFKVPALLFNPALVERSVLQYVPETYDTNGSIIKIVLGQRRHCRSQKDIKLFGRTQTSTTRLPNQHETSAGTSHSVGCL